MTEVFSAYHPLFGPMRILVADDNPVNQLVLEGFLEKFGYAADLVDDGRKAIDANRKGVYDLIFMDCRMPIMDGFAAARAIRLEETRTGKHVRILAMTADVTSGIEQRCLEAGMDGYFSKPLPMEALREILREAAQAIRTPGEGRKPMDASGDPAD